MNVVDGYHIGRKTGRRYLMTLAGFAVILPGEADAESADFDEGDIVLDYRRGDETTKSGGRAETGMSENG